MSANAVRRLRELHQKEGGGGGRKFSKSFFSLKRLWSSSVRFSEEGRPTRRIKKTQGDISVSRSLFPPLFLSPHMRGKQDARLCPVSLVPSQTERTYTIRGDEL